LHQRTGAVSALSRRPPAVGEQSRIFHILLNNIPHAQWPQGLRGTSGLPMYDAEEGELGDFTSPNDPRFEKQLRAIVDAVEKTLDAFPKAPDDDSRPIARGGRRRRRNHAAGNVSAEKTALLRHIGQSSIRRGVAHAHWF
jgi:hypothetical protein